VTLSTGTRLGPYEILAAIGAGGMGEVYRARDTKLGRDVAIKVLPEAFARDPERLARFEREARVLASLNHPNIAAIYGFEQSDGIPFLVLEYVPGETLRGPLPVSEALRIAGQIAEALENAHEKAFVHRDLKPANIKVTPEGKVKVLDFGLAKAFTEETVGSDPSQSPTISAGPTRTGMILGTAAYMSPEQARAKPVDKRTDIWAFGCVLYETLAGRQVFPANSVADAMTAILGRDPDWQALPLATPPKIRDLLHRCLQKELNRRLRDIGDARIEIEETLAGAVAVPQTTKPPGAARWRPVAIGVCAAVAIGVALWAPWRGDSAPRAVIRTAVVLPPSDRFRTEAQPAVAISPDGARLVYSASRGGRTQLYFRQLDQFEVTPIAGTEDAGGPFLSPDGEWVGFFAGGKLKKVALRGGPPVTLCDAPNGRGASWGPDGQIVFTPAASLGIGLWRVSASGSEVTPQPLTTPDAKKGEASHRWPYILPGGESVLFTSWGGGAFDASRLAVLSLKTGERRVLLEGGHSAHYASSGHLVFMRAGGLWAAPFDLARLQVTGPHSPMLNRVVTAAATGAGHYSFAANGTLVYIPGGAESGSSLLWVDRKGVSRPLTQARRVYMFPRLSPDGGLLAVTIIEGANTDIWVYDLGRDTTAIQTVILTPRRSPPNPRYRGDGALCRRGD